MPHALLAAIADGSSLPRDITRIVGSYITAVSCRASCGIYDDDALMFIDTNGNRHIFHDTACPNEPGACMFCGRRDLFISAADMHPKRAGHLHDFHCVYYNDWVCISPEACYTLGEHTCSPLRWPTHMVRASDLRALRLKKDDDWRRHLVDAAMITLSSGLGTSIVGLLAFYSVKTADAYMGDARRYGAPILLAVTALACGIGLWRLVRM